MTMTQRYSARLRRHASEWEKQAMPVQAEITRQAARHMEELQTKVDAITSPWQPLTDEQIQDLLGFGNPTEQESYLIRLGWNAAHGIGGDKS